MRVDDGAVVVGVISGSDSDSATSLCVGVLCVRLTGMRMSANARVTSSISTSVLSIDRMSYNNASSEGLTLAAMGTDKEDNCDDDGFSLFARYNELKAVRRSMISYGACKEISTPSSAYGSTGPVTVAKEAAVGGEGTVDDDGE